MLDVTGSRRIVSGFAFVSNTFFQRCEGLAQIHAVTAGDVEHLAGYFLSRHLTRQQVRRNYVLDEGKVAALRAIAINSWLLPAQHGGNELRHHTGILRRGILARAKDVE